MQRIENCMGLNTAHTGYIPRDRFPLVPYQNRPQGCDEVDIAIRQLFFKPGEMSVHPLLNGLGVADAFPLCASRAAVVTEPSAPRAPVLAHRERDQRVIE